MSENSANVGKKKIIKIIKKKKNNKAPANVSNTTNATNNYNNSIVQPTEWVLPNKKEFPTWINETFIKYKSTGKTPQITPGIFKPFKYQNLLRDYMQNSSPYRGILLYHGLGSGKTCTAIQIAENLKTERNIVVMLPASLRTNFINDGLLFCGSREYRENPDKIKEKYTFISYNANNTIAQIRRIGSLDNKVIIIEEVHNLISKMMNGIMGVSKQGLEIYNYLMNAQNAKIIAMSGTPVINDPFEAGVLFNILKGYIEITYFRILKVAPRYGDTWDFSYLEQQLAENNLIDYFEINKVNKSIQFQVKVPSYSELYRDTMEKIEAICNNNGVQTRFLEVKRLPLFPIDDDGDLFRHYFVKENVEQGNQLKNQNVFKKRILGLVSYYKSEDSNYPDIIKNDYYRIPMSNYQFQIYELLRAKERLSERGSASGKRGKQVKSTFRVFSRQASNFVFPETINRPYPDPKFIVSVLKKNNNKVNINKMIQLEERANNGIIEEEYKDRINNALDQIVSDGLLYLRPGPDGLDKLSPKMKMMLENIQRSNGLVFVYSNFRTLEGVEIFAKILDFNGFALYGSTTNNGIQKYAIYSGTEDEREKKEMLRIFTSDENKHGKFIKIILATSAGAEGLDLKNIRQIHIMEPYWNLTRIEQVIGRGVRRNSHIALPPNERNVEIFQYFSVFSEANSLMTKDKLSTDEHIEQLALKKHKIITEMLVTLKECSFDCFLNGSDNKDRFNCFSFGKGASGFSYYPDISKDIVESGTVENKKVVKRVLTKAVLDKTTKVIYLYDTKKKSYYLYENKNEKSVALSANAKKIPIFVDKELSEIYDVKSTMDGNPNLIGYIKNGKFSRNK